jgi:hypothetical protein
MVSARIATGAEQPINRHAAVAASKFSEGDLVGYDATGKLVPADADAASQVMAVGVAFAPVHDLADYSDESVKLTVEQNRALINRERISYAVFGVEVENGDDDWDFTPGAPVYLASGGGYTQTAPATAGDLVQMVGVALTPERIMVQVVPSATTA